MKKWDRPLGPDGDVVLGAGVSFARNFGDLPFPGRMDAADRREVIRRVRAAVDDEKSALAGVFRYVSLEDLTDEEAVSLAERRLADADFIAEREGRGLLLSGDESLCILINGEDHLLIRAFGGGFSLKETYERADTLESLLSRTLSFAFDRKLGYLTPNPADLGTGMLASLSLHLPALADFGALPRLSSGLFRLGMSLRSAGAPAKKPRGAVYRLCNRMTLGLSEREAIANLTGIGRQVVAQERSARRELSGSIEVQDTVSRSLGLLRSARLLKNDEFLELISLVRFGIAAGFVHRLEYAAVDRLAEEMQPATLTLAVGRQMTAQERWAERARIVRETLGRQREPGGN